METEDSHDTYLDKSRGVEEEDTRFSFIDGCSRGIHKMFENMIEGFGYVFQGVSHQKCVIYIPLVGMLEFQFGEAKTMDITNLRGYMNVMIKVFIHMHT